MRSRLTARQMYERFLDGQSVMHVAYDAYSRERTTPARAWSLSYEGQACYVRTEDSLRRSCRKAGRATCRTA